MYTYSPTSMIIFVIIPVVKVRGNAWNGVPGPIKLLASVPRLERGPFSLQ